MKKPLKTDLLKLSDPPKLAVEQSHLMLCKLVLDRAVIKELSTAWLLTNWVYMIPSALNALGKKINQGAE